MKHVPGSHLQPTRAGREKLRRIVRKMFQYSARNYLETLYLPHLKPEEIAKRIRHTEGLEHLDEALAQGIKWGSKLIISAPCCQHHLQKQLDHQPAPRPFEPVERHSILKERLGDILTDTFRALILRIMGYQTDVVQFVSSEHTAKNLMIRAAKTLNVGEAKFVREYRDLKDFWKVTPYLEQLSGEDFTHLLAALPQTVHS